MDNNDFEIVGRISIDDQGSVKLEATNKELQAISNEAGRLSSAMSKLGEMTQYVFGELLLQGVLTAGKALANFITESVGAANKHQQIMAQFNAELDSANAAADRTATATASLNKVQGQFVTVTAGSTKEITKTQKALDKAKQSLDLATASYDSHAKHSASATMALQQHRDKVAALQDSYDKLTKTMTVQVTTNDKLKRTIDANAAAVTMTREQILLLADGFAKTTIYSKDMQIAAETSILQFDRIGKEVFPLAMQASEDLAAHFNIDLAQAAEYVGRALGDPAAGVGILQRQFQLFEPTQLKAIENMARQGKTAEAQKAILDALAISISGSSTAAARTFAGQMQIFNNSLEEAKIKIGTALIPALTTLVQKLGPLADKVLPLFGDALTKVVVPAFGFVLEKAGEFLDWVTKAGGPIDTVKNAISDLVSKGLGALGAWWSTNGPAITLFFNNLGTAIGKIPDTMSGIVSNLKAIFQDAISKVDPKVLDAVGNFITKLATGLHNIPNTISTIANSLSIIFTQVFNQVKPELMKTVGTIIDDVATALRNIPNDIARIAQGIKDFAEGLKQLGEKILSVDPRAMGFLITGIGTLGAILLVAKIPSFITAIAAALGALDLAVLPAIVALLPLIIIIAVVSAIVIAAATNFHGFGDRLAEFGETLRKGWATAKLVFEDMVAIIQAVITKVEKLIEDLAKLAGMETPTTGPGGAVGPGHVGLPGAGQVGGQVPYSPLHFFTPQKKASGGPVMRGQPYMVGEDGPELFVPEGSGNIIPNQRGHSNHSIVNNYYFGQTLYNPEREQGQDVAQAFRKS